MTSLDLTSVLLTGMACFAGALLITSLGFPPFQRLAAWAAHQDRPIVVRAVFGESLVCSYCTGGQLAALASAAWWLTIRTGGVWEWIIYAGTICATCWFLLAWWEWFIYAEWFVTLRDRFGR